MKAFIIFIGMALAGVLGYIYEPTLRPQLLGKLPPISLPVAKTPVLKPAPDFSSLTPEQLPSSITLKAQVNVKDPGTGVTIPIDAGSNVIPKRIEGANVIVQAPQSASLFPVPVNQTDLSEILAARPPASPSRPPVDSATSVFGSETAGNPPNALDAVTESKPEAPPVNPAPEPAPAPAPTAPELAPQVTEIPDTPPAAIAQPSGNPPTIKAMQESLKAGEIDTIKPDQVRKFEPGPEQAHDGVSYQTGIVEYKGDSIFGPKISKATALVKDGKVVKWLWPSGREMK